VALTIAGFTGLADGETTVWESPQARKAASALAQIHKPQQTSERPDLGM
jgi:hypothetical protein